MAARAYLGVPFVHQGRTPRGLDCIGLVTLALQDAGLTQYALHAENRVDYGRDPNAGLLEQRLEVIFGAPVARGPVDLAELQPGDVVAIRFAGPIRHVALIGAGPGYPTLIHTDSSLGRVTEHRIDPKWQRRIALVFRPEIVE